MTISKAKHDKVTQVRIGNGATERLEIVRIGTLQQAAPHLLELLDVTGVCFHQHFKEMIQVELAIGEHFDLTFMFIRLTVRPYSPTANLQDI